MERTSYDKPASRGAVVRADHSRRDERHFWRGDGHHWSEARSLPGGVTDSRGPPIEQQGERQRDARRRRLGGERWREARGASPTRQRIARTPQTSEAAIPASVPHYHHHHHRHPLRSTDSNRSPLSFEQFPPVCRDDRRRSDREDDRHRGDRLGMPSVTSRPRSTSNAAKRQIGKGETGGLLPSLVPSSSTPVKSPGSTELQELHEVAMWEASWQVERQAGSEIRSPTAPEEGLLTPPTEEELGVAGGEEAAESPRRGRLRSSSPFLSPERSPKRRRLLTPRVSPTIRGQHVDDELTGVEVEDDEMKTFLTAAVAGEGRPSPSSTLVESSLVAAGLPPTPSLPGEGVAPVPQLLHYYPLLEGCRKVHTYYRKLNKISEGTYGAVYRAQEKTSGKFVALKHIKYHERVWEEGFPLTSLREISILLDLKHPHIVDVVEVVVGANPNHVYMVMEYVEHELKLLLEDNRPPFSAAERKTLLRQLLEAVAFIHGRWVIHRDLKTSNLLYSNKGELKVCDFGMARKFGEPIKPYTHNVVTLWYRAPELLLGEKEYTEAVDLWSVGCIFGELILRKPLFNGKTEANTLDKIFKLCGTPDSDVWPGFFSLPLVASRKIEFAKHAPSWREVFPVPRTHITVSSNNKTDYTGEMAHHFIQGRRVQEPAALSDAGLNLLSSLLSLDPRRRISAREALNHPFFSEKPLPQRTHLMPTAPDSNVRARGLRHPEDSLNEEDRANRNLFRDADFRFSLGKRVDPARYLVEMETAAAKLKKTAHSS